MSFNWFDLVVLFGILQGVICAVLLLGRRPVLAGRKLLVAVLLVFSVLSFKILLHTTGLWNTTALRYFPLAVDLLIQPLLYLYVASLTQPGFKMTRKTWLHFLPPLLFMVHAVVVYVAVMQQQSLLEKDVVAEQWRFNRVKVTEDFLSILSTIGYGFLGLKSILYYRRWMQQNISDTNYLTFTWIKNLLIVTGILGIALCVNIILDNTLDFSDQFLHWKLFYIYLAVVIYYIGLRGYLASRHVIKHGQDKSFDEEAAADVPLKYSGEELENAKSAILHALITRKVFLDSELTLGKLAADVGLSPVLVSVTINRELGKTFRMLVNDYRAEEVKRKLTDSRYAHLSIFGVALECGFNSEASFYRIFKSATGLSPKEYAEQAKLHG
ncbi:helix-turn-helix domain-containing protein [Hufsiella ginkgonis]|uniref:Helix-turn-helix domain-containing protein n=1 Tax=Hufsiella ginkgonis TaxID=2695274 RepID=A0A7K1Y1Z6_9SPHI|nr:AraC family transcriptional regulator [Hufsiella ginkgonis]MXV17274.1 helix-turn-helix domain-containing protein [Hufsiella ginkgonis]